MSLKDILQKKIGIDGKAKKSENSIIKLSPSPLDASTLRNYESFIILILKHAIHDRLEDDFYTHISYLIDRVPLNLNAVPYSTERSPDICLACFSYFGHTIGGRLRNGCHVCQQRASKNFQAIGFFTLYSQLHPAVVERLTAETIYRYLLNNNME